MGSKQSFSGSVEETLRNYSSLKTPKKHGKCSLVPLICFQWDMNEYEVLLSDI